MAWACGSILHGTSKCTKWQRRKLQASIIRDHPSRHHRPPYRGPYRPPQIYKVQTCKLIVIASTANYLSYPRPAYMWSLIPRVLPKKKLHWSLQACTRSMPCRFPSSSSPLKLPTNLQQGSSGLTRYVCPPKLVPDARPWGNLGSSSETARNFDT